MAEVVVFGLTTEISELKVPVILVGKCSGRSRFQPEPSLICRYSAGGLINAMAFRWRTNFGSFG